MKDKTFTEHMGLTETWANEVQHQHIPEIYDAKDIMSDMSYELMKLVVEDEFGDVRDKEFSDYEKKLFLSGFFLSTHRMAKNMARINLSLIEKILKSLKE